MPLPKFRFLLRSIIPWANGLGITIAVDERYTSFSALNQRHLQLPFLSFQIKNNAKAQNLIHNATEEIKNLLNINEDMEKEFANGTAKLKITRKMQGASSQVSW